MVRLEGTNVEEGKRILEESKLNITSASDLDDATRRELERGARLVELLKQPQYQPMSVEKQVMVIYAGTKGWLDKHPVTSVGKWESEFLAYMAANHPEVGQSIADTGKLSSEAEDALKKGLEAFDAQFSA